MNHGHQDLVCQVFGSVGLGLVSEAAANLKPHSSEKTAALGNRLPHWGHCNSSFVPHRRQNLASWRFSTWHFGHSMVPSNQKPVRFDERDRWELSA